MIAKAFRRGLLDFVLLQPAEPMQIAFCCPFALLLLCIAAFPLLPHHYGQWWDRNRNKLIVSSVLSLLVLFYYGFRETGVEIHGLAAATQPGWQTSRAIISQAIFDDYIPFIVLLLCLYTVAGGIRVIEDIPAHPLTNTAILALGAILANLIGTTGASMLLIRPLLQINSDRTHKAHTVVFFIFIVSNVGGVLTPIGDPPLFLGYLHGVPFWWTVANLWKTWAFAVGALLAVYLLWDMLIAYPTEPKLAKTEEERHHVPLRIEGAHNLIFLVGIVFMVATAVTGEHWLGTGIVVPKYGREIVMLMLAAASYMLTPSKIRVENSFNFGAIFEVAALFLGIFVTMSVPMEMLREAGQTLNLNHPAGYFWASGALSSFLDNAPTYLVFFSLAQSSSDMVATHGVHASHFLQTGTGAVLVPLLTAISLGSVFMGANSYIGNGPNFMVKKIADEAGVKMPSFFGYMGYSCTILVPLFLIITWLPGSPLKLNPEVAEALNQKPAMTHPLAAAEPDGRTLLADGQLVRANP